MSDDASFPAEKLQPVLERIMATGGFVVRWTPGEGSRLLRLDGVLYVFVDPHHLRHLDREALEATLEIAHETLRPYVEVELAETAEELVPHLQTEGHPLDEISERAFERLAEMDGGGPGAGAGDA